MQRSMSIWTLQQGKLTCSPVMRAAQFNAIARYWIYFAWAHCAC